MGCELRRDGNLGILKVEGKLALGAGVEEFRQAWSDALGAGCRHLVINLAAVPMIDSSGIGTLIRCHSAMVATRGKLRLVATTEIVRQALRLSRLDTIFQFYDDDASAIASFEAAPGSAPAKS